MSYFGKNLTGGSIASSGYEYQDTCALISLFQYSNDRAFKSITIETLDDFTILALEHEMLVQVKKFQLSIGDMKELLDKLGLRRGKRQMYICTGFTSDLRTLMQKKVQLLNALQAGRKPSERNKLVRDYKEELRKFGLTSYYNKLMQCDFVEYPENQLDAVLYCYCSKWLKQAKWDVDVEPFLMELLVLFARLRRTRGFLDLGTLREIASKHSVVGNAELIVEQLYKLKYKRVSEILQVLGKDNERVLEQLEARIREADEFTEKGFFAEALEIYHSLSVLYPVETILLQCAQLRCEISDYSGALSDCERVLRKDPSSFDAQFYKGVIFVRSQRDEDAIEAFKKAYKLRKEPAAAFNIGQIYSSLDDIPRAMRYYKQCAKVGGDTAEVNQSIAYCYYRLFEHAKALVHVDKAIDLDSELYSAYLLKADLLRFLSLYDEAIPYYKRYLMEYPDNEYALYGIALCMLIVGLSEGIIYFAEWIQVRHGPDLDEPLAWVDMGWKESIPVSIVPEGEYYNIDVGGVEGKIERKKMRSWIYIGAFIEDGIYTSHISKIYENMVEYKQIIQIIRENIKLKKVGDVYYDEENKIKVIVQERNNYSAIDIRFGTFGMMGITDPGTKIGFNAFLDGFQRNKSIELRIGSGKESAKGHQIELFTIRGVRNVSIEHYNDSNEGAKNTVKNLKRHKNLNPDMVNIFIDVEIQQVSDDE